MLVGAHVVMLSVVGQRTLYSAVTGNQSPVDFLRIGNTTVLFDVI